MMNQDLTLDFYNDPQNHYAEETLSADMRDAYSRFLRHIPAGGMVMDLGCGSGRDSLFFINKGFRVTPIDGSYKMCDEAEKLIGYRPRQLTFDQLDYEGCFDGVWACASLLHVSGRELPDVLRRIAAALKPEGVLYASWKYGDSERTDPASHRFFCDMNEGRLTDMLNGVADLDLVEMWRSDDALAAGRAQVWMNVVAKMRW